MENTNYTTNLTLEKNGGLMGKVVDFAVKNAKTILTASAAVILTGTSYLVGYSKGQKSILNKSQIVMFTLKDEEETH